MRIMGLDVGDKTIGVAVSDSLGLTAQGVTTVKLVDDGRHWRQLEELCREYTVDRIVVGLPKNMDGSLGPRAEKVHRFAEQLAQKMGLPVETWDERLSTVAAERVLLEADMSRRKRKGVIDKMAAVIILQGYLDAHR
ncbi:MAG: Holliday junction resolvase RuvX [Thermoanaerobacteraceae bacterium]|nr:Holliday junction resolvase RuvX [Thermoanaerobacteraceae bacterium]